MFRDLEQRDCDGRRQTVTGAITAPDVAVGHEGQQRVGSAPFCVVFQTDGVEHRETINDSAKSLAEDESLQVGGNGLPLVIVGIRESRQRQDIGEEAMGWRDSIVGQGGDGRKHDLVCFCFDGDGEQRSQLLG